MQLEEVTGVADHLSFWWPIVFRLAKEKKKSLLLLNSREGSVGVGGVGCSNTVGSCFKLNTSKIRFFVFLFSFFFCTEPIRPWLDIDILRCFVVFSSGWLASYSGSVG